ncbi:MAG: hypothetical protein GYB67_12195 [Chloroflexi bacterium]|nr:hypothetical protein [Chloroflexota bacterium]
MQSPSGKPSTLIKPTLDTCFHIDYTWWETSDEDLRTYLLSHLPPEEREALTQKAEIEVFDHIDPETAEVFQVDEIGLAIQNAARQPDFINPHTSLVDSIFRVFLSNHNTPLTPRELAERIGRQASVILKTLSGGRIYKGIRTTDL